MSARWIAPSDTLTTSVGQIAGGETEANGTTTQTRRDLCLWHASEAVRDTSIRGDRLVASCTRPELVEVERMIKMRDLLSRPNAFHSSSRSPAPEMGGSSRLRPSAGFS
jgi:hypothetical protein